MIQKDKKNNDCFQENKTLSNVLEASIPELMLGGRVGSGGSRSQIWTLKERQVLADYRKLIFTELTICQEL